MSTIWVLTTAYNDYDQHGDYFVAAFPRKPTRKEFYDWWYKDAEVDEDTAYAFVDHMLAGGGRRNYEYQWYELTEYKFGTKFGEYA